MIRTDRPRILWVPEDPSTGREQMIKSSPAAVALVKQADLDLRPTQYGGTDLNWNLGCAYLITGDAKYADRAIALSLLEVEKGEAGWKADSGYYSRSILPNLAICLDWCFDRLTPEQRAAIEKHLRGWVDWIWTNAYGRDKPETNYYWGHVWGSMAAALALGDEAMLTAASDRLARISGYLGGAARGGWLHDGFSYGAGMIANLMLCLSSFQTAVIDPVLTFAPIDTALMRCLIAATLPDNTGVVPFGDQSDDAKNKWNDRDLLGPRLYQAFATEAVDEVRDWLMVTLPTRKKYYWQAWAEFMFPVVGAVEFSLPQASFYVAEGAGFAAVSTNDLKLFFRCGPNLADHADLAAGQLMVYRGSDPVLGIARCNAYSGTERDSPYHNTITVDGRSQSMNNPLSKLEAHEDTPTFTYLRGSAPDAYQFKKLTGMGEWANLLESYTVEVLLLKEQSALVVRHRVRKVDPASVVTLHTHCLGMPAAGSNGFSCDVGQSEMVCTDMLPRGYKAEIAELRLGTNRPGTGDVTSWRRDITALGSNKEDTFLLVFQFGRIGFAPLAVGMSTDAMEGDHLFVGDAVVSLAGNLALVPPIPPAPPKPTLKDAADAIERIVSGLAGLTDEVVAKLQEMADWMDAADLQADRFREAAQ